MNSSACHMPTCRCECPDEAQTNDPSHDRKFCLAQASITLTPVGHNSRLSANTSFLLASTSFTNTYRGMSYPVVVVVVLAGGGHGAGRECGGAAGVQAPRRGVAGPSGVDRPVLWGGDRQPAHGEPVSYATRGGRGLQEAGGGLLSPLRPMLSLRSTYSCMGGGIECYALAAGAPGEGPHAGRGTAGCGGQPGPEPR